MKSQKERQAAIKRLRCMLLTPKTDVKSFREKFEKTFYAPFLPNQVESSERDYSGVKCDVLCPEIYASRKIAVYIHGGAFVAGSRRAYRSYCASLAHATSCRVVVPEFRLAPAHPYPAALEDVQAVINSVYNEELIACSLDVSDGKNSEPELIIMADTSGASIALAVMMSMKERVKKSVSRLVLFSPWLSISPDSKLLTAKKAGDEVFTADSIKLAADYYTYLENRANPLVSPLKADRRLLQGLPPVYIQMGEKEMFLDDVEQFQVNMQEAGCECTLDIWPSMMPMFQLADEYLHESHLAVEKIGLMITGRNVRTGESVETNSIVLEQGSSNT
ncbi:MAG: alpha/beta hydrolase [Treponema sp.]|nr:alpha/beta hydrolase [Treponema sp.]